LSDTPGGREAFRGDAINKNGEEARGDQAHDPLNQIVAEAESSQDSFDERLVDLVEGLGKVYLDHHP